MDHFGIGNAFKGMAIIYCQSARRTGRTTSLVESLNSGDRVICTTAKHADHLRRQLRLRDLDVEVLVFEPSQAFRIFEQPSSKGRTLLDHTWVEQYYLDTLEKASSDIDKIQRETSGYGTAHIETRRQAEELNKWRI